MFPFLLFLVFKVESGKKRPNQSAVKTPVPAKKAKPDTPQKIGESLVSLGLGELAIAGWLVYFFVLEYLGRCIHDVYINL